MPNIATHKQVSMPPIGSSGSGLASYKDLIHPLKDEKKVTYMPLADIVYQSNCVVRSTIDTITLVAAKMSSITCKPSNLVNVSLWTSKLMGGFSRYILVSCTLILFVQHERNMLCCWVTYPNFLNLHIMLHYLTLMCWHCFIIVILHYRNKYFMLINQVLAQKANDIHCEWLFCLLKNYFVDIGYWHWHWLFVLALFHFYVTLL